MAICTHSAASYVNSVHNLDITRPLITNLQHASSSLPPQNQLLLATVLESEALHSLLMDGRDALFPPYSMAHGRGASQDSIITLYMCMDESQTDMPNGFVDHVGHETATALKQS